MIESKSWQLESSPFLSCLGSLTINAVWNTTGATVQPTYPLVAPRSISFDSSGNIYVVDVILCAVFKYSSCGTVLPTVFAGVNGTCGSGASLLNLPEGAFLDNLGNLYVVSLMRAKWHTEPVEIKKCRRTKDGKSL
jgi:hypothetical protein